MQRFAVTIYVSGLPALPLTKGGNIIIPFASLDQCSRRFVRGSSAIVASPRQFIWAHLTVGRSFQQSMSHPLYNHLKARTLMACSLVERDSSNKIAWSQAYDDLDPSEKTMLSYAHGMAAAKLVLSHIYDVPWASHVSLAGALTPPIEVVSGPGKEEPDLIGPDSQGRWVIAEAKGRRGVTNKLKSRVRTQLNNVTAVRVNKSVDYSVYAKVGSILRTGASPFAIDLVDPPGPDELGFDPEEWRQSVLNARIQQLQMEPLRGSDIEGLFRQIDSRLNIDGDDRLMLYLVNDGIGDESGQERQIVEQLESEFTVETMPDGTRFIESRY